MFYPGATIVTIAIFFAAWLFVSGFFEVITSFTRDGDTGSRVLHAIIGVLSVIVGFALLRTPVPVGRGLHLRPRASSGWSRGS